MFVLQFLPGSYPYDVICVHKICSHFQPSQNLFSFWPVQSITAAGVTGPATVIIQGIGIGMVSCVGPVLILVATILGCNALSGEYGIGKFNYVWCIHKLSDWQISSAFVSLLI